MRIVKQVKNAEDIVHKWLSFPSMLRPKNIVEVSCDQLEYDFVEGQHPTHWEQVHDTLKKALWCDGSGEVDPGEYIKYVRPLCTEAQYGLVCRVLGNTALTPVWHCHGDCAFANMLLTPKLILLRPQIGLQCREIDEANILQSLDGWEWVRYGRSVQVHQAFPAERVHWVLLLTRYLQTLGEQHPAAALAYAASRAQELTRWLS